MIDATTFLGQPTEFFNLCLIYPPKVIEVTNTKEFGIYTKLLTISQEEIEDDYAKNNLDMAQLLTPFEYLLTNVYHDESFKQIALKAFEFFIHEPVTFLPESRLIVIGELEKELLKAEELTGLRIITEDKYFLFQNMIRESIGQKQILPPNPNENVKIKRMKAKARLRDKIKAKQSGLTLTSMLASICCMKMGLNPLNIGELSYAALSVLMQYYQGQEQYDLGVRQLLAGADKSKVKLQYWIKNIEDD